jgi:hypothetical protein
MPRHPSRTTRSTALIAPLVDELLQHQATRLRDFLAEILNDNALLTTGVSEGAYFKGARFVHPNARRLGTMPLPALDPSLEPSMQRYVDELAVLRKDRDQLSQRLAVVLTPCSSSQDIRDALPESFVELVKDFQGMPRTRPEGWVLDGRPEGIKRQFQEAVAIALRHQTIRLLF